MGAHTNTHARTADCEHCRSMARAPLSLFPLPLPSPFVSLLHFACKGDPELLTAGEQRRNGTKTKIMPVKGSLSPHPLRCRAHTRVCVRFGSPDGGEQQRQQPQQKRNFTGTRAGTERLPPYSLLLSAIRSAHHRPCCHPSLAHSPPLSLRSAVHNSRGGFNADIGIAILVAAFLALVDGYWSIFDNRDSNRNG